MLLMVEKGIKGGVSMISNRYGKSNNKYMGDMFVPSEPCYVHTQFYLALYMCVFILNGFPCGYF